MEKADPETLRVYDARVEDYAKRFGAKTSPDVTLTLFMSSLPPNARVLDMGCGPGNASRFFVEAGFEVDAFDASAGMVAAASAIDGLNVWQATFDDLDAEARYDGIWANFSLLHAPRDAMPGHLSRIVKALKPEGRLHIGLKEGTGEQRDTIGRFYTFYSVEEVKGLLAAQGLYVSDLRKGSDPGLDGSVSPWFTLNAHA